MKPKNPHILPIYLPRLLLVGLGASLIAMLGICSESESHQTNTAKQAPKIVFFNPVIDLGRVTAGISVKCEFLYSNAGNADLEITDVRLSCGCTTAGEWTRKVPPEGTGKLPIEFHASLYPGMFIKTVSVINNDPTQPSVVLQLRGEIWKPIQVDPQVAAIYITPDSDPNTHVLINLTNNETAPIEILSTDSEGSNFQYTLITNNLGWWYQIQIKPAPQLPIGTHQGKLTITTTSSNCPSVSIPVIVVMRPPLTVSPPTIHLPAEKLAAPLSYTITIHNNGPTKVEITEVKSELQGIDIQIKPLDPGRTFRITVQFPEGFELPTNTPAVLKISTTSTSNPELFVPITKLPVKNL